MTPSISSEALLYSFASKTAQHELDSFANNSWAATCWKVEAAGPWSHLTSNEISMVAETLITTSV